MDIRYNELDELACQASLSILADCGPSGVPSTASSQICKDNVSNVSNVGNSSVNVSESNLNMENSCSDNSDINYYGSAVLSDGTPRSSQCCFFISC